MSHGSNVELMKLESNVQMIKYQVLMEVAKQAFNGTLKENYKKIPYIIVKGPKPITRCCVYHERAVVEDRVKVAMGGDKNNKNVIEVLESACDECPMNRYTVTEACRDCLAHKCSEACPFGAITHVGQRAYINHDLCRECGRCAAACPYNAISDVMRPCMKACKAGALTINENKKAKIDNDKCIECGSCAFMCPFGAIMDKSYITNVIDLIKNKNKENYKIYAVIAPAISSQFSYAKIGQVVKAIKTLGFHHVIEAALGADMVALHETHDFAAEINEKNFITSSCCPAFVKYIEINYPQLMDHVSTAVSPMIAISRLIKETDHTAKVVFIGPCTAKKAEINEEDIEGSTDYVLTFEELLAMLDAKDIQVNECQEDVLDNASFYGRIFARSGGLTESVKHVIMHEKLDADFRPVICSGLKECDMSLKLAKIGKLNGNFIEGMACLGGCIGGAASLNHAPKDRKEVDKYGEMAKEKGVADAVRVFDMSKLNLDRDYNKIMKK